jgi:phospholipase C
MSLRAPAALVVLAVLAAACTETVAVGATTPTASPPTPAETAAPAGDLSKLDQARQHIDHLIFIVQENRSFDHYFGTYPGAKGIPMTAAGKPEPCIPDPVLGRCVRPFHSRNQWQKGGPHSQRYSEMDVNGGRMDGFVGRRSRWSALREGQGRPQVRGFPGRAPARR